MSDVKAAIDPWDGVTAHIVHADLYPAPADWRIESQICPYDDFFLIWKGMGWVEIDGVRFEAKSGDLFIIRRDDRLAAGHDPTRPLMPLSTGFHLRRHGAADAIRHLSLPSRLRLQANELAVVQPLFMELIAHHHAAASTSSLSAAGSLLRLVGEILRLVAMLPATRRSAAPAVRADADDMAGGVQTWID